MVLWLVPGIGQISNPLPNILMLQMPANIFKGPIKIKSKLGTFFTTNRDFQLKKKFWEGQIQK